MLIETVNLNVWSKCDLACRYCYGRFPERPSQASVDEWRLILDDIAGQGVRRVTFCGGEPTLHPRLADLLAHARALGLQTSIVTNGARLTEALVAQLDVVGMTLDDVREEVLLRLGRTRKGSGPYLERFLAAVALVQRFPKVLLKVNTVVTRFNLHADLRDVVGWIRPYKWKPLQFTEVFGENERDAESLAVTLEEFDSFVRRHRSHLEHAGIWVEPEGAATVRSTYVMVDPSGRLFSTATGRKRFSSRVVDVGLREAVAEVGGYDRDAFLARGGDVDVRRLPLFGGAR